MIQNLLGTTEGISNGKQLALAIVLAVSVTIITMAAMVGAGIAVTNVVSWICKGGDEE